MKKPLAFLLSIVLILSLAAAVSAMTHTADYVWDGTTETFERQVGHWCNTGAEQKVQIEGDGLMERVSDITMSAGKLTVDKDLSEFETAEDAADNLTVTSVIELCAPPKHEYTTTKHVPVDSPERLLIGEGQFLVTGYFNPVEVSQVIPVYPYGYGEPVEVVENEEGEYEFAVPMDRAPGALVFTKEAEDGFQEYKGYLNLIEGELDHLPSQYLAEEEDVIDLGAIQFEGSTASPEEDPIGEEIDIGEGDLGAVAVAGSFLSAVAMNEELVESYLDGREILVNIHYHVSHVELQENEGYYKIDAGDIDDFAIQAHRMNFSLDPGYDNHESLRLEYPKELEKRWEKDNDEGYKYVSYNEDEIYFYKDPGDYGDELQPHFVHFPGVGPNKYERAAFVRDDDDAGVPPSDEYSLFDGDDDEDFNVSFELPAIIDTAQDNLIMPKPEVHVDEEGYINNISLEYYTTGGIKIENPENIIRHGIGLQFEEEVEDGEIEEMEDVDIIGISIDERDKNLSNEEIKWDEVASFNVVYNDVYGLHYVIPFKNPSHDSDG